MKILFFVFNFLLLSVHCGLFAGITPYKFTDPHDKALLNYQIPSEERFTLKRPESPASDIVFYLSKPGNKQFPIAILCGGSSTQDCILSIVHFHRYFLKEFQDLGAAVLTVEQRGVDGNKINKTEFMQHYTRSARLHDHQAVIEHLQLHPPQGWNGEFIFLGVSEGGSLVTTLTAQYAAHTKATINWSGAGDWSWRDELLAFIKNLKKTMPWYVKPLMLLPRWVPFMADYYLPGTGQELDQIIDEMIKSPVVDKKFMSMTYCYHADVLSGYPMLDYRKIRTPFLVVAGMEDSIIQSCDAFVERAQQAGAPITYLRIAAMDHYIRKRPDVIAASFEWLEKVIK